MKKKLPKIKSILLLSITVLFLHVGWSFIQKQPTFTNEPVISEKLAEKVALIYGHQFFGKCFVVNVDKYYTFDEFPYYYVVSLGLTQEASKEEDEILDEFKDLYESKNIPLLNGIEHIIENKKKIYEFYKKDFAFVIVNSTRDRVPLSSIRQGLPINISKQLEALNRAKELLKGEIKVGKVYITSSYQFSQEFYDSEKSILLNLFSLKIEDKNEYQKIYRSRVEEGESKTVDLEKRNRIRAKWKLFESNDIEDIIKVKKKEIVTAGQNEIPTHSNIDYLQTELGLWNECYIAASTSIMAYWDDHSYNGNGPWEQLLLGGDASNISSAYNAAWDLKFYYPCGSEVTLPACDWGDCYIDMMTDFSNSNRGASFSYDNDCLLLKPMWGTDIKDEIDDGKPVHYCVWGHPVYSDHAVVVVGWWETTTSDNIIICYDNNFSGVSYINWDDGSDHITINVTPGGSYDVKLDSLHYTLKNNVLSVFWESTLKHDSVGYNILLSDKSGTVFHKINLTLIKKNYFKFSISNLDIRNCLIKLEEVSLNGNKKEYGPIEITDR